MLSDQNGVVGLHQRKVPTCIAMHCVCHRLNLAISNAAGNIVNIAVLQKIVTQVYQHINNSPNRLRKFKDISSLLANMDDGEIPVDDEDDRRPDHPVHTSSVHNYLKFKRVTINFRFNNL